jgi:hypothetical protein
MQSMSTVRKGKKQRMNTVRNGNNKKHEHSEKRKKRE